MIAPSPSLKLIEARLPDRGVPTAAQASGSHFSSVINRERENIDRGPIAGASVKPAVPLTSDINESDAAVHDGIAQGTKPVLTAIVPPHFLAPSASQPNASKAVHSSGDLAIAALAEHPIQDEEEVTGKLTLVADPVQHLFACVNVASVVITNTKSFLEDEKALDGANVKLPRPKVLTSLIVKDGTRNEAAAANMPMPIDGTAPALPNATPSSMQNFGIDTASIALPIAAPTLSAAPTMSGVSTGAQLLNAMAAHSGADQHWLEGVASDIAASSQNGDVRFRVQPAELGSIAVSVAHNGAASHLTIAVAEPRALSVVAQAHNQFVASALALGVPISGSSVTLDHTGSDRRGSNERARRQIEVATADESSTRVTSDLNRYA